MKIINAKIKFNGTFGKNEPQNIIIHHALAKKCTIYDIDRWHKEKSWSGCGYHYFVQKDGRVYKGRSNLANGAHCEQQGMNKLSIGICLEGCYQDYANQTDKEVPKAQMDSLVALVKEIKSAYRIPLEKVFPHSHFAPKLCPGNYFPWDRFIGNIK